MSRSELVPQIVEISRQAAQAILEIKDTARQNVESKEDNSPVTLADKAANTIITQELAKLPCKATIVAEESELPDPTKVSEPFWLVDPLDGTKDFIKGTGDYTVNIALVEQNQVQLGVIFVPERQQAYFAARGHGSFRCEGGQQEQLTVRSPGESPIATGSRFHKGKEHHLLESVLPGLSMVDAGSSLKFCRLAEGKADIYLRLWPCCEWDTAAGQIILEEAGGHLLSLPDGGQMSFRKDKWRNGPFLAVANRAWWDQLAGEIQGFMASSR